MSFGCHAFPRGANTHLRATRYEGIFEVLNLRSPACGLSLFEVGEDGWCFWRATVMLFNALGLLDGRIFAEEPRLWTLTSFVDFYRYSALPWVRRVDNVLYDNVLQARGAVDFDEYWHELPRDPGMLANPLRM